MTNNRKTATGISSGQRDVFCKREFILNKHKEMEWTIKIEKGRYIGVGVVWDGLKGNFEHAYEKLTNVFCLNHLF